jgi:hypothetical protein
LKNKLGWGILCRMEKYKAIKINGKKIDEHRLVLEKYLGRKLTNEEIVHHIDGDKSDNSISNLMLFPNKKAHAKFHFRNGDLKISAGKNKRKLENGKLKCHRCGILKELSEFVKTTQTYLGVHGSCKLCENARRRDKYSSCEFV